MMTLHSIAFLLAALPQEAGAPTLELEGPLNNDAFVLTHEAAQGELARGDRSWQRAQADFAAGTRERGLAYEAWHSALELSETGDAVALALPDEGLSALWPDPEDSHRRRGEGVSYAILRRLHALDERFQGEWRERFGDLAAVELAGAGGSPKRLALVERNHPWTRAAALAGMRLSDLAFERGATADARAWLARASEHAGTEQDSGAALGAALRARITQIEGWTTALPGTPPTPVAQHLELVRSEQLEGLRGAGTRQRLRGGLECGLGFTDSGSVIIQTALGLVHYRDMDLPDGPRILRTRFRDILGDAWNTPFVTTAEGGWPLQPAVTGDTVVVVVGRSIERSRGVSFAEGDALVSSPTNILAHLHIDGSGLPEVEWTLSSAGLRRGDGSLIADNLFESGAWEIQPGPCVHAGRVYVQVRVVRGEGGGEHELWLWAFDLVSGEPLWSRFLTKPSGLPGAGATSRTRQLPTPTQPLTVVDGRVFAGTNAGLGLLFDGVDGRLTWSVRNRRRSAGKRGWTGARRAPQLSGTEGPMLVWTPFDSDHLYILAASADLDGQGLLRRSDLAEIAAGAPFPIGSARELIGGSGHELLVLGANGPRRALSAWLPNGERRSSIYLGRGEGFAGSAWTSDRRLLAASDRYLYMFDRELRLLDSRALPDVGGGRGGSVYAHSGQFYVLGQDTLWHFRPR
ncbi:MAG: outer membrane protein assembly factor BamB [Chlamydiales bacterium]|jgi:outer membrane protein assembly factor BamB